MGDHENSDLDYEMDGELAKFMGAEMGLALAQAHSFLHTKNFKQLKGTDRACLANLQMLCQRGVCFSVSSHLYKVVLSGVQAFQAGLAAGKIEENQELENHETCIYKLPSGAGMDSAVQVAKDFSLMLSGISKECNEIFTSGGQSAAAIYSNVTKWNKESAALKKALGFYLGGIASESAAASMIAGFVKLGSKMISIYQVTSISKPAVFFGFEVQHFVFCTWHWHGVFPNMLTKQ